MFCLGVILSSPESWSGENFGLMQCEFQFSHEKFEREIEV